VNRSGRAAKGFVTAIAQYFIVSLSQILLAPFILRVAGAEVLGAYSFLMQILGVGLLLDLGLSVALSRFLARSYVDEKLSDDFFQFFRIGWYLVFCANILTGLLFMILGLYLGLFLEAEPEILRDAKLFLYTLGVWYLVRTPLQIYVFAMHATQNMSMSNYIQIAANLIRVVLVFVLISYEFGLLGMLVGYLSAEFIGMLWHRVWFRGYFYQAKWKKAPIDKKKIRDLFSIGFKYWGVHFAQILGSGTDALIVGKLFGAKYVAMIYLTKMPALLGTQLIYKISDNSGPAFNEIYANSSKIHIYETLCKILKISAFIALPFSLGTIFFTDIVLGLWVGSNQYVGTLYVLGLGIVVVTQSLSHVYAMVVLASGNLNRWAPVTLMAGGFTCIGSFLLGKNFGLQWIIIPAVLAEIFVCSWLVLRVRSIFHVSIIVFLNDSLIGPLKSSFFLIIPFALSSYYLGESNITAVMLILHIVMLFLVWIYSVFYIGLIADERVRMIKMITTKISELKA